MNWNGSSWAKCGRLAWLRRLSRAARGVGTRTYRARAPERRDHSSVCLMAWRERHWSIGMLLMPYIRGFLIGVLLGFLALYVEDHVKPGREASAGEPQKIANSDVAAQRLRSSLGTIKEEVHEATR
jgi:hypothetical protein